ncbi:sugar phosphate isomerase/epimerase family protein [Saccharibacillus sp. CPCC 101409]|uniref:sugar phosphate isomerase/epimerase family protein n=1 Tax=Saccharibacillus sp. CPCC 101409 TaxID=3058041 RepID=UPI002671AF76|nr:sugar phosphate isomerase/epimerase family protein [Saccharibacillus sp. CPCC 101409]MDO3410932.1 sugar phosphate isomerase/epimerase family protein [Saccharibacillus sp. CPCC 101409]
MISIYDWFGYELPIEERYRAIKQAGFDGVMLWWSAGFGRGEEYRSGARLAREAGLTIENIHAPIEQQNDLWLNNAAGEEVVDCYLGCIEDCADLEIPTMVIHLPDEEHIHNPFSMERFKRIVDRAERRSVNVAVENLWNLTNLTHVLDTVDSPRIGFCYDVSHHNRYYPEQDLLAEYGERLKAVHLHDNNGSWGQHGLPFDGTLDWAVIMQKVAETGYAGGISIEAMNWDYLDLSAEEFLLKAFGQAKKLEQMKTEYSGFSIQNGGVK